MSGSGALSRAFLDVNQVVETSVVRKPPSVIERAVRVWSISKRQYRTEAVEMKANVYGRRAFDSRQIHYITGQTRSKKGAAQWQVPRSRKSTMSTKVVREG